MLLLRAKPALVFGTLALSAAVHAASDLRLIEAIKEQGGRQVPTLIEQHADVNSVQPDGATPLAWAVYLDQVDTVDRLLKAGAKVNTADEYGDTPLTLACSTGDFAIVEKLIAAGADAKAARWNGETALMIASRSGSVPSIKLLLAHGASIDSTESRKGQNALMWAAAEGHSEVVQLLIESGAHAKAVSNGGFTPLVFATQRGDAKSVKSLLDAGLSANYKLPNGISILQVAVLGDKAPVADVLLTKGADANAMDQTGSTPLHVAAQLGNLHMVKALLASGANPNAATNRIEARGGRGGGNPFRAPAGQQTPLLLAARAGSKDVMQALVTAGADPGLKAQDGSTLLMAAAGSAHLAPVEYAFELAPDVTAVNARKSTVMHAALSVNLQKSTQAEVCKIVQFLVDKGADPDALDASGRTPIAIGNIIPIDDAVTLLNQIILARGQTPKISATR